MNEALQRLLNKTVKRKGSFYLGTTSVSGQSVIEEKAFTASHYLEAVANNASVAIRLKAVTNDVVVTFLVKTEGKAEISSYSGTTFSADGTVVTAFNRYVGSTNAGTTVIEHTPTVDTLGTLRLKELIGAGGNVFEGAGGSSSDVFESYVPAGEEIYLVVKNTRGSAQDINIIANYHEE